MASIVWNLQRQSFLVLHDKDLEEISFNGETKDTQHNHNHEQKVVSLQCTKSFVSLEKDKSSKMECNENQKSQQEENEGPENDADDDPEKSDNSRLGQDDCRVPFINAANFNDDGTQLALTTTNKDLLLINARSLEIVQKWRVSRRCTAVRFLHDGSGILVADKSGDVYLFKIPPSEESLQGKLMCGHLSMLSDIAVSANDRYIITCDRDEKIRVSRYPETYVIYTYCLGHTSFVTSLTFLWNDERILVSTGGDGTVRCWAFEEGKQLCFAEVGCPHASAAVLSSLTWDPSHKECCAAHLHCCHQIVLFNIESTDVGGNTPGAKCCIAHKIDCQLPIANFCVLERGLIFIFLTAEMNTLKVFSTEPSAQNLKEISDNSDDSRNQLIEKIRGKINMIGPFKTRDEFFNSLKKVFVDGAPEYFKRKDERLSKTKEKCKKLKTAVADSQVSSATMDI